MKKNLWVESGRKRELTDMWLKPFDGDAIFVPRALELDTIRNMTEPFDQPFDQPLDPFPNSPFPNSPFSNSPFSNSPCSTKSDALPVNVSQQVLRLVSDFLDNEDKFSALKEDVVELILGCVYLGHDGLLEFCISVLVSEEYRVELNRRSPEYKARKRGSVTSIARYCKGFSPKTMQFLRRLPKEVMNIVNERLGWMFWNMRDMKSVQRLTKRLSDSKFDISHITSSKRTIEVEILFAAVYRGTDQVIDYLRSVLDPRWALRFIFCRHGMNVRATPKEEQRFLRFMGDLKEYYDSWSMFGCVIAALARIRYFDVAKLLYKTARCDSSYLFADYSFLSRETISRMCEHLLEEQMSYHLLDVYLENKPNKHFLSKLVDKLNSFPWHHNTYYAVCEILNAPINTSYQADSEYGKAVMRAVLETGDAHQISKHAEAWDCTFSLMALAHEYAPHIVDSLEKYNLHSVRIESEKEFIVTQRVKKDSWKNCSEMSNNDLIAFLKESEIGPLVDWKKLRVDKISPLLKEINRVLDQTQVSFNPKYCMDFFKIHTDTAKRLISEGKLSFPIDRFVNSDMETARKFWNCLRSGHMKSTSTPIHRALRQDGAVRASAAAVQRTLSLEVKKTLHSQKAIQDFVFPDRSGTHGFLQRRR